MSDKELLELLKNNSTKNKGFSLLIDQFQEKIYWQIKRIINDHQHAEDVTQNVFVKIFNNIDKFRGDAKLTSWIYRIAYNESISFLNKKAKIIQPSKEEIMKENIVNGNDFSSQQIIEKLTKAIETLPIKQKAVFSYRYFEELKYTDIAEIMNVSVGSLKATYHIAAKKIEKFLVSN